MRRLRKVVWMLGLMAPLGCDALMTEPAEVGADLAIVLTPETTSGERFSFRNLSGPLAAVRSVWFRFSHDGTARDTVVSALAIQDSVRVRALLRPDEARGWLEIQVELRMSDQSALFRGRTLVQSFRVSPAVSISLLPVVSDIQAPRLPQRITALGESVQLAAQPRFANGDLMAGAPVAWTSGDPAVIDVVAPDRAVSRSSGLVVLTADVLGTTRDFPVEVLQTPVLLTGVGPADTTITVGATYQARPFGADANGFPLLPGATVQWTSQGAVEISPDGTVTAVAPGDGTIRASWNGETHTAQVTVTP